MAREEKTISELTSLATVNRSEDLIPVVDVSDTTDSEYGTTKKTLVEQFVGDKGDAATVDVGTTTTLSAGSDATVSNSGSTSAAVLDFGIPRGPQGAQGIQGVAGADGTDGANAYVYIAYASDASGTGFTLTFNASLDYIAIKATTTEIASPVASDFTGLWKNYKGAQGIQGIQGIQGVAGADGVNAYVYIAYASDASGTGFTTTFDANLDYVAIKTTTTEIVTPQASDFTGLWKNYKGATGATGPAGANGVDGEDGLDINWRGNYASGTAYVINDAVFYSGSSYICKLASTGNLPTNTTYWDLMAQQGAAGTGSGDVSGPASATDNAIARFDLTTGKLIQDSLVTVDDNGSINIPSGQQYLVNGSPVSGYSDEQAQDAIGTILADTTTVDLTYTDDTPSIKADIKSASLTTSHLASGVLDTDLTSVSASDDTLPSAKATKTYVDSTKFTWRGAWATTTAYAVNDTVENNGSGYVCTADHTSSATTEPGVGTSWTDKWDLFVEGLPEPNLTTSTTTNLTGVITGNGSVIGSKTNPSGAFVGTTDTQTLTNKTLTAPALSSPTISGAWDGWIGFPSGTTCTYVGADDPTYTMYVSGDASSFLSIGMKFECFQSGMKFFFVTAIGSYDSGNDRTLVTLYGGTDYDLANAEIGLPAYSMMKSPQGFPMSPLKWTVELEDTTNRTQASPSPNVWYNMGSLSLSVPIGAWDVSYDVTGYVLGSAGENDVNMRITLSTANNSESDVSWTSYIWFRNDNVSTGQLGIMQTVHREGFLTLSSKASYYLNGAKPGVTSATDNISFYNSNQPCIIRATCAYL